MRFYFIDFSKEGPPWHCILCPNSETSSEYSYSKFSSFSLEIPPWMLIFEYTWKLKFRFIIAEYFSKQNLDQSTDGTSTVNAVTV